MKLYHGTSSANVASIMENGLQPRRNGDKGNWYKSYQVPSLSNFVYLTNEQTNAEFYAIRSALITKSDPAIIEVEVDGRKLYPDENLFNDNFIVMQDNLQEQQRLVKKNKKRWRESLKKRNLVSYHGPITPSKISKIEKKDLKENTFYGFVENFEVKDIDTFDLSFQIGIHLINNRWFQNNFPNEDIEWWKSTIKPDNYSNYIIWAFRDKEIIIQKPAAIV